MLRAIPAIMAAFLGLLLLVACGGVGVEILSFTSPLKAGEQGVITARARAGVSCRIAFGFMKAPGAPQELPAQQADGAGFVSWNWRFDPSTAAQQIKVTLSCDNGQGTAQDEKVIEVA